MNEFVAQTGAPPTGTIEDTPIIHVRDVDKTFPTIRGDFVKALILISRRSGTENSSP